MNRDSKQIGKVIVIVAAVALISMTSALLALTQNPPPDLGARPRGEPIAPGDSWMKSMHDDFGVPVFYTGPAKD